MDRRRTLVTSAAIAAVTLAGATAVAANVGILNSADSGPIGDLSAAVAVPADKLASVEPQFVDVYLDGPTSVPSTVVTGTVEDDGSQQFTVDAAGTVSVVRVGDGIRIGDVAPSFAWEWTSEQTSPTEVVVRFTAGDATFVFTASLTPSGSIEAGVEQPVERTVVVAAPQPGVSQPAASNPPKTLPSSGEYDDDHDDHGDEQDDDHGSEYEGGEDDD